MGKQNFITFQLLAISGILISILVSMIAFRQFSLPESKASSTETVVAAPYLKVEKKRESVENGKKIIEAVVYANTNGMRVSEVDIVMDYDTKVLQLLDRSVVSTGALAIMNVNKVENGVVDFSLFSSATRNEPTIFTNSNQEIPVAHLKFQVVDSSASLTQLQLEFTQGSLEDSNMILEQDPRPETSTDILNAVQAAIITLQENQ